MCVFNDSNLQPSLSEEWDKLLDEAGLAASRRPTDGNPDRGHLVLNPTGQSVAVL
jgi:hypothetical protein